MDIRAIVLRFNNPATHKALEYVMQERSFAHLATICAEQHVYSGLPRSAQHWFSSSNLRGGLYVGVDETSLLPIDAKLLESMRDTEAVFMHLVTRLEYARKFSHDERRRMYLLHLRFWNDYIEKNSINLFLSGILPHEIPDYVIYGLCKVKGIPTLYFHASVIRDCAFLEEDWKESARQVGVRYQELLKERPAQVRLPPVFEQYFEQQSTASGKPPINFKRLTPFESVLQAIRTQTGASVVLFFRWVPSLLSLAAWHRRMQKLIARHAAAKLRRYYDAHAVAPDLALPFVYVPLHFQPECSTCPMAGAFVDQVMEVQLLSATVPDGVLLYVKEHPRQYKMGIACRTIDAYEALLALPNVRLICEETSSFLLREHAKAVATGTGTAGFEALFRGKPVFLFGHRFYQYAPGVFCIRSKQDCIDAVLQIFSEGVVPKLDDVRLYLKAMADTCVNASVNEWHQSQASSLSTEDHAGAIAGALSARL